MKELSIIGRPLNCGLAPLHPTFTVSLASTAPCVRVRPQQQTTLTTPPSQPPPPSSSDQSTLSDGMSGGPPSSTRLTPLHHRSRAHSDRKSVV